MGDTIAKHFCAVTLEHFGMPWYVLVVVHESKELGNAHTVELLAQSLCPSKNKPLKPRKPFASSLSNEVVFPMEITNMPRAKIAVPGASNLSVANTAESLPFITIPPHLTNLALLNTKHVAEISGEAEVTVKSRRQNGTGPTYIKLGRNVRYRPADVITWLQQRMRTSTSEAV